MTFVFFALARKWHPPLHALHSAKNFLSSWSPWQTIGHATLRLTPPCATRTICIGLHSLSTVSIDFLPVWDYPHPSGRLSIPFSMLIANNLFADCYFIASFWLGPSLCTIPHSPLHTLRSALWGTHPELVYHFGYPHAGLLFCCAAISVVTCPFDFVLFKLYRYKTIQARYIKSELSSNCN